MPKFLPYILKTLWRHRSRTIITVSGSAIALFVFCFVGAVQQGMNDLEQNEEARQSLILFQANKFCPFTSHLPQDYENKIQHLDGIREVIPIQVYTNNCRASLDVIVFYGVPPKKLRTARNFDLIAGNWSDFEEHQDAAVVGRAVAQRRGLHPGDKFSIGDLTVQVAGIFTSHDATEENYIYSHLDFLQRRNKEDLVGTVTQHEVLLAPGVEPTAKAQQIDAMFRGGPVATDTRPKGVFQAKSLGDLMQLIRLARYLAYSCVGLVLALVTTTTLMSVQDRIREHAILQTLGFTGSRVFQLVVSESTLLSIAGGILGVGAAMLVLQMSHLSIGAEAVTIAFRPSLTVAIASLVISAIVGMVAGIAPAWHAARTEIVPALRN